jgi:hypothetical protein
VRSPPGCPGWRITGLLENVGARLKCHRAGKVEMTPRLVAVGRRAGAEPPHSAAPVHRPMLLSPRSRPLSTEQAPARSARRTAEQKGVISILRLHTRAG